MKELQTISRASVIILIAILNFITSVFSQTYEIADEYYQKGDTFYEQGKYSEAANMYVKSAEAEQECEKPRLDKLGSELNDAGYCYRSISQYDKAIKYYELALEVGKKHGIEGEIAIFLNNIGFVYNYWGQYDKAIANFGQALEIDRRLGIEENISIDLNNIGMIYKSWGQYDKAITNFKQALEIDRKLGNQKCIAEDLNNIGSIYDSWGQYDKAIEYYEQVLEIDRKFGYEEHMNYPLSNIAMVYIEWKQYDKAIANFEQALEIDRKFENKSNMAKDLNNIGNIYYFWKQFDKAIEYYEQSIAIKEKIRLTAKGDIRRDFMASQIKIYQFLISACINNKQADKAFKISELSSAKYLAEQIANNNEVMQIDLTTYREKLTDKIAVVKFANINFSNSARLVLNKENIYSCEVKDSTFIATTSLKYKNEILPRIIKGNVNFRGSLSFKTDLLQKENKVTFDAIINYYRALLISLHKTEDDKIVFKFLSQQLYTFLFADIEQYIKDKNELIILSDDILGFIPFETLIMPDGRFLCEKYNIHYQQSLAVSNLIAQRQTANDSMLAIGGAVYNEKTYKLDMKITDNEIAVLHEQTLVALNRGGNLSEIYDKLQRGGWNNLPGTKVEATAISLLDKKSKLITGKEANETLIKEMSKSGELKKYRILHFATHGTVVPEIPELSAVILSLNVDTLNDGYLRMREIAELEIQAQFVNLSACETGLGRIYGGEGVVGLTQSWLIAGAKGLSVSLWQVDDIATKEFMIAMYKKALEENMTFDQAIYKTKIEFLSGKFGDQYKEPYFWAPFVYYGN